MQVIQRKCPLCDKCNLKGQSTAYSIDAWPMKTCQSCSMVYLEKAPDPAELFEALAWEKTATVEDTKRNQEQPFRRRISRMTRMRLHLLPRKEIANLVLKQCDKGKILDVGCGIGDRVLALPTQYTPYGIEISKALAARGQKTFESRGGKLANNDALNGLKSFSSDLFDVIVMRSFLEHDVTPLDVLRESHRTLKPGLTVQRFNQIYRNPFSDNMWLFATRLT